MSTIPVGSAVTFNLGDGQNLEIASNGGFYKVQTTPNLTGVTSTSIQGPNAHAHTFGPYPAGATLILTNQTVDTLTYVPPPSAVDANYVPVQKVAPTIFVKASGDTTGATDLAAINAAVSSAVSTIKASGTIANIVLVGSDFYINDQIVINDGIHENYPTASSADMTIAPNFWGIGKGVTRINMLTAGKPAILVYCKTASTHLSNFRAGGFALFGPGGANTETVGIQIGGITASAVEDFELSDIEVRGFVAGMRTENVCNGTFRRCLFGSYTRGVEFGYNSDVLYFEECRWGDENDAGKTGTALSYTYHSALNPTGGSINAHTFKSCWFMRQVNVANISDSTSGVIFNNCYYERCTQYATIGQTGSATGQRGIFWEGCHFSQPYDATETLAKIEVQNSSDDSTIGLRNCRTDDTQGAFIGWVKVGADTSLGWEQNILPAPSGHAVISFAGRNIDISSYHHLQVNRRLWATFDDSLVGTGTAHQGHVLEAYNCGYSTGSETQIARFVNVNKSTGSVNGSAQIITLEAATVCFNGAMRSRRSTALPTATSQWEGVVMTVVAASGSASVTSVCLKSAGDTYSWKTLATG